MSTETNCSPYADCPPTPAPVMPRCDVVLPDGTYTNATIVVEDGCITEVQAGAAPLYTPDPCCPTGGGGTGGDGLDGPPGPPGQNATIAIGTVTSLPFGTPPTVTNTGTPTNAILNWGIPRGEDGADAPGAVTGVTNTSVGIEIVDGLIKAIPVQWPPVMMVQTVYVGPVGIDFQAVENPTTGIVTITLDMTAYDTALQAALQASFDQVAAQMSALQTQLISLQEQLLVCCPASSLDLDGDGNPDPGGTPGVSPPPPVDPN